MDIATTATRRVTPWNKGKLLGQKPPLKLKEIWAIRIRLQLDHRTRVLALFNLAIDSKLRGCDLVGLRVHDVVQGSHVAPRAIVMQKRGLGRFDRTRSSGLRHPFAATHQADADLPAHQESSGDSAPAWTLQVGKHSQIPRDRGRRRAGDRGAN
jgi:hypothetical protein